MFRNALALVAVVAVGSAASAGFADVFTPASAGYWCESYTDAAGNYHSPAVNGAVNGGVLSAPIATDATDASPDNDVVNYLRTRSDLPGASAAYNGSLLGNLSSQTSVTATFNITNTALAPGQQFTRSQLVGETDPFGSDPALRFTFTGVTAPTSANTAGNPNQWWSTINPVVVTNITNGDDVTFTVDFDPSHWKNVAGYGADFGAAETLDFQNALAGVKFMGLSFGSGKFYADGFAFNTGGDASINLSAFYTSPSGNIAAPAPASLLGCMTIIAGLGLRRLIKRPHRPVAC